MSINSVIIENKSINFGELIMPIKKCTKNGKCGYKWGNSGKCYTGKQGKSKAKKQMRAIYASGYKGN